jgi:hypothetical protein
MIRTSFRFALLLAAVALPSMAPPLLAKHAGDPRLNGAFRAPAKNGWTYVRLEGTPAEIGFQNGYLLSA